MKAEEKQKKEEQKAEEKRKKEEKKTVQENKVWCSRVFSMCLFHGVCKCWYV